MTLKEVMKNQQKGKVYNFYFIDMEKIYNSEITGLLDYPVKLIHDLSGRYRETYRVLISKEAQLHAKNIRKVKNCFECLRFSWCEDLTDELRIEHAKDLENNK